MHRRPSRLAVALTGLVLVLGACATEDTTTTVASTETGEPTTTTTAEETSELTPVSLQLQWFTQGQFAGYFAALDEGFYEDAGLDVTILEGGVDIVPQTVLDSGGADFAISWVPKALVSVEEGASIVDIAQIFQRSGTLQVSFADSGIDSVGDLAGKTVGNWGFGNEFELLAGLRRNGIDPASGVTLVQQSFDMLGLLSGEIDAAQAMTYNEFAQVLETVNPDTDELYTRDDLSVIDWNDVGTAMLQDAIWADAERLASEPEYRETAVKFVEASLRGWIFCRDNPEACVDIVLAHGPTLGASHQTWQVNEVNKLVWPSPLGIGMIDPDLWAQTIDVATAEGIISADPGDSAYRTDIVEEALANLEADGVDVTGEDFEAIEVTLTEGGS